MTLAEAIKVAQQNERRDIHHNDAREALDILWKELRRMRELPVILEQPGHTFEITGIKPAEEEHVAVVVESTELARDVRQLAHADRSQPAVVERVVELMPYDYIWNEQTRNFEPVLKPGNATDFAAQENARYERRFSEAQEKSLAAKREALALADWNET